MLHRQRFRPGDAVIAMAGGPAPGARGRVAQRQTGDGSRTVYGDATETSVCVCFDSAGRIVSVPAHELIIVAPGMATPAR